MGLILYGCTELLIEEAATLRRAAQTRYLFVFEGEFVVVCDFFVYADWLF